MANEFWEGFLAGLEPTAFPDLTGYSPSARKTLTGHQSTEQAFHENYIQTRRTCNDSTWIAAVAKILGLYSGDTDICIYYTSTILAPLDSSKAVTVLPIRISVEHSHTIEQVLFRIDHDLDKITRHGPPSPQVLQKVLDTSDTSLSDVLIIIDNGASQIDTYISECCEQFALIVVLSSQDTSSENIRPDKITFHLKKACVLPDDVDHIHAAFREALSFLLREEASSLFWAWRVNLESQLSTYNPEVKSALQDEDPLTVHGMFEKHVATQPNEIALDYLEDNQTRTQWSFSTLDSIANCIADKLLSDFDVQIEDSIPICVPKSPAFYACVLAVLKAGAVFTPFAGSPPERKKLMLEELQPRVLLAAENQDMSWAPSATILDITSILEQFSSSKTVYHSKHLPYVGSSTLCYQMYTSGSTGRPKAVSLEHGNAVQTACATQGLVPWNAKSRLLQQAGVTFDMCYFETFFAWKAGICLCSASNDMIYNRLIDVINGMDVSLLGLTPSVALTLDPEKVPGVRWLYCIGEALPQSLVETWEGRLVNSYGPTEAAQMVTLFPVDRKVNSAVVGQPFGNTSFTVLRKDSTEVMPILGVGELCIGGLQVARGYYKNPEKTTQSFIDLDGKTVYRTGDLVRMLGNETFEFIGRLDDQVKIRGQRVELGEIDKALELAHEAVGRACTQVLKVSDKAKSQLVAFLTLKKSAENVNEKDVRDAAEKYLSGSLPSYMVPKFFIFIDQIPLSLSGKIDKRSSTKVFRESDQITSSSPPSTLTSDIKTVQTLQAVYSEHCGMSPIDIEPNISVYQLGIDSISAIQIAHDLNQKGFQLQASDIMTYPTVSEMASFLNDRGQNSCDDGKDEELAFDFQAFDKNHRDQVLKSISTSGTKVAMVRPASPLQTSMITMSSQSSTPLYFNHLTYELPPNAALERVFDAWEVLVSKHDILRSGFVHLSNSKSPIVMVTYYARSLPCPVSDMSSPADDIDMERSRFVKSAIDNFHQPPWRVWVDTSASKLYFSAHHALYDAQILDVMITDLGLAYDGKLLPAYPAIEPHLSRFLSGITPSQETTNFWRDMSKKTIACHFPLMQPVLEEDTTSSTGCVTAPAPKALSELEKGCREAGITMQAAAQAAWGFLLSALCGEESVTFGTVLSGRTAQDASEVCFPMITTVPTIINIASSCTDVLRNLLRFNADVQRHQYVPLTKIHNLLGFTGDTLFDTIFTFQKRSQRPLTSGTSFKFLRNTLTIEYPVSVELEPTDNDQLLFSVFYQTRYMKKEQASLLVEQYHMILQNIMLDRNPRLDPDMRQADSKLFSIQDAKHESLSSKHSLMHHSVEISAMDHPKKTALEFVTSLDDTQTGKQVWSFDELNKQGNRVAHLLQKFSVPQGSIVAICFDKCPEAPFSMLGISKAGCAFLALDPSAPIDRKKFIMQDAQAALLLTKGHHVSEFREVLGDKVVDIEEEDMSSLPSQMPVLDHNIDPQDMAYCLYTSGTTGTPKGCILTHENVIQAFLSFEQLYAHTDESRWLQFASYHFDVSVMEHFWSWFVGITVVKASRDLILQDLAKTISTLKITHIDLTPSLARLLDPEDVPTLANGVFVTGGEMLRKDIISAWGNSGAIHNAYGPTEATIGVTMNRHVPENGRPSNIGQPFPVVGVFVVHRSNSTRPVLRGGVGELLVSGKLVAKGYLHRDELTKERFITVAGKRCYKTGDLVRLLSDGSIEFLGRADDQIKLRGQRLEIGEINNVIRQADERIDDVSTLVLKHPKQQKEQLISFVAIRGLGGSEDDLSLCQNERAIATIPNLRSACSEKLPGYMVPTHILLVNKMPLSANNKIEGKQLEALYKGADLALLQKIMGDNSTAQGNAASEKVIKEISDVLSQSLDVPTNEIRSASSLFELGLDSISMINFSRALKKAGFPKASPSLIMQHPSIGKLAAALSNKGNKEDDGATRAAEQLVSAYTHRFKSLAVSSLEVKHEDIEVIAPCTALQAGMISRTLETNQGLYFTAFHFDLVESVDLGKLRKACQTVCDRVQILRARFIPSDDGYLQVFLRQVDSIWIEQSANDATQANRIIEEAYADWWHGNQQEIRRPFELLLVKTPEKTSLTLHIFHALYDGNSLPIIMDAVLHEYNDGSESSYGPPFSKALVHGPLRKVAGAEDFWVDHLLPASQISLTELTALSENTGDEATSVTHKIDSIGGFEECRRKLNVTHQAIFQACWAVLLQDIMSGPLILGMIVSGRSIDFEAADQVIGPLFNTIPFLLCVRKEDTWATVIKRAHAFNSGASTYHHTPLRDIQKWMRKHKISKALFDTLFVFQQETERKSSPDTLWSLRKETFEADYPLSFEVEQSLDGEFNLTLACQATMSNQEASQNLLVRFERMLKKMVEDVDVSLTSVTGDHVIWEEGKLHPENSGHSNGESTNNSHTANGHDKKSSSETTQLVRQEIAILARVDRDEIYPEMSIFEVGLDSIDAVKLSSRLKKATNIHLPVSKIMRLLKICNIAGALEAQQTGEVTKASEYDLDGVTTALQKYIRDNSGGIEGVETALPCTPLQEGMVAEMLNTNFEKYLNFDVLKLSPDIDVKKLKEAVRSVVNCVPILRSRFVEVSDPEIECAIAQIVIHPPTFEFASITKHTTNDFSDVFQTVRKDVKDTFGDRPALRFTFVQEAEASTATHLVLTLPHAMYDGWSLGLIHDAIHKTYRGERLTIPDNKSALSKILNGSGQASLEFWRQELAETKVTLFPTRSNGNEEVHRSERCSKTLLQTIQKFCKQNGVTIAALCQTVWSVVLAYYTKQLDVAFAQVLSGRTDESTNDVVFPTMSTVVSRSILHGSGVEMVKYLQDTLSDVSEYQHFPLRKALALVPGGHGKEIFNTLFIFQKSVDDQVSDGSRLYQSVNSSSSVEYPVCVEAEATSEHLVWRTASEDMCLDRQQTEELLDRLDVVIQAIIDEPEDDIVVYVDGEARFCKLPPVKLSTQQKETTPKSTDDGEEDGRSWSEAEQLVRQILADVAKISTDDVNKQSTLFGLGLDSISTIKVSSLLRKKGCTVDVNSVLSAGSVSKIAGLCNTNDLRSGEKSGRREDSNRSKDDTDVDQFLKKTFSDLDMEKLLGAHGISTKDAEHLLPVSAGQMLLLSRWQNENVYYSSLDFSVIGHVSLTKLRSAWQMLVEKDPLLRTIFLATAERSAPMIQVALKSPLPHFVEVQSGENLEKAAENVHETAAESLNPPCTLLVQQKDETRFDLALKISHALYDGFSLKMLIGAYQDSINNIHPESPTMGLTFARYLSDTRSSESKREYWTTYLSGLNTKPLPQTETSKRDKEIQQIHVVRADVLPDLGSLREFAKINQVSVQSLLLASYSITHATAIRDHGSQSQDIADVLIGIFMANRNTEGADELAAPTLGFAPVRVRNPLARSLIDIAHDVQDDLRELAEEGRGQVGLWELKDWIGDHVRVDVWVNILRQWLPDDVESSDGSEEVQVVTGEKSQDVEKSYTVKKWAEGDAKRGLLLKDNVVRECYDYPMMDLEATVKDDNVDIGIQAPTSIVSVERARDIIADVAGRLRDLVKET